MIKGCCLKKSNFFIRILLPLLVFFSNQPVQAAEQVGVVVSSVGNVTAGARSLARRSPIYQGDTVNTTTGAKVAFKFTDGSVVNLKEGSSYNIANYSFKKDKPNTFDAKLLKGGLKTVTGKIGKEAQHTKDAKEAGIPEKDQVKVAQYKVNAATTTIGVRGTNYKAMLEEPKTFSITSFFPFLRPTPSTPEEKKQMGKLFISALEGTVTADIEGGESLLLGDGADASFIEIFDDGSFVFLTQDPIPDEDFNISDDEEEEEGDDEDSDEDEEDEDEEDEDEDDEDEGDDEGDDDSGDDDSGDETDSGDEVGDDSGDSGGDSGGDEVSEDSAI